MELHSIKQVFRTDEPGVYIAVVDLTDSEESRYETEYVSRIGDTFGLATSVRSAIDMWLDDDKPVADYPTPVFVPDRVSARQFGLQLIADGIKDQVDAWVAMQDAPTRWAYEKSGSFVRSDPMLQAGFAALGFTDQEIDDFFTAASRI